MELSKLHLASYRHSDDLIELNNIYIIRLTCIDSFKNSAFVRSTGADYDIESKYFILLHFSAHPNGAVKKGGLSYLF